MLFVLFFPSGMCLVYVVAFVVVLFYLPTSLYSVY